MSKKRERSEWISNFQEDLAKMVGARLYDLNYEGKLDMSHEAWEKAAVACIRPLKRAEVDGLGVEVEGGVVQNCWAELQCEECGNIVYPVDGYKLKDHDVEDEDVENEDSVTTVIIEEE